MSTIGSNVASVRIALGITVAELARRAKWDRPNLLRLERGEGGFSEDSLRRLADALGVPVAMLWEEKTNVVAIRSSTNAVPLVDYVQAGEWTGQASSWEGEFEMLQTESKLSNHAFALRIKGDSMRPGFEPGDTVIIDPSVAPLPGDFVVAANGEDGALFKQYRERELGVDQKVIVDLHPLNEMYPVIRGDKVPVRIVGTMIEHRKYRKHR